MIRFNNGMSINNNIVNGIHCCMLKRGRIHGMLILIIDII